MAKPKLFNGKPVEHWEKMGHELVVNSLVRAASNFQSALPSVAQKFAAERLMALALAEDPVLVRQNLEERDRCIKNLNIFVSSFAVRKASKPKRKKK